MSNGERRRQRIPRPEVRRELLPLRFSFKHLDLLNQNFPIEACDVGFMERLLRCLQRFSTWAVAEFQDQNNNEHRHIIDFDRTREKGGFTNVDQDQLGAHEAWQFSVCPESWEYRGRVHGILIEDTFYIVWLDPRHRLFPQD